MRFYVCNYGSAGNVIGGSMYKIGAACTACPSAAPSCDDSLCVCDVHMWCSMQ
jgi:hypothetical protein